MNEVSNENGGSLWDVVPLGVVIEPVSGGLP